MSVLAGLLVGLAVAQGVAPAAPASATSVQVVNGQMTITAGPGVNNQLSVSMAGRTVNVTDGVTLAPGTGCARVTDIAVSCTTNTLRSVVFTLGDGDDMATFTVPVPVSGRGGPGDDTIRGGSADDTLSGGAGVDVLFGGPSDDMLYGDSVSSEPSCRTGTPCHDTLHGEDGSDYLAGGESGDHLHGGPNADELDEPTSGSNILDGGTGDDRIIGAGEDMRDMAVYSSRTANVGVNLSNTEYKRGEVVLLPAGIGGEMPNGVLVERDSYDGVQDIATGAGDDILIGFALIGPDGEPALPVLQPGAGIDRCDFNGDDGVVLTLCP